MSSSWDASHSRSRQILVEDGRWLSDAKSPPLLRCSMMLRSMTKQTLFLCIRSTYDRQREPAGGNVNVSHYCRPPENPQNSVCWGGNINTEVLCTSKYILPYGREGTPFAVSEGAHGMECFDRRFQLLRRSHFFSPISGHDIQRRSDIESSFFLIDIKEPIPHNNQIYVLRRHTACSSICCSTKLQIINVEYGINFFTSIRCDVYHPHLLFLTPVYS